MAVPGELHGVLDEVDPPWAGSCVRSNSARFDVDDEGRRAALTVQEAVSQVEAATIAWFSVADSVDGACDAWVAEHPGDASEIRACQSALMLLQLAVVNELALVQRLETIVGTTALRAVPGWPTDDPARLEALAFRPGGQRDAGLIALLYAGTDDGPEPGDGTDDTPGAQPGGSGGDAGEAEDPGDQEYDETDEHLGVEPFEIVDVVGTVTDDAVERPDEAPA